MFVANGRHSRLVGARVVSAGTWSRASGCARSRSGSTRVEADSPFYALPSAQTVERWAAITPQRFTFAVKVHRALSRHAAPLDSLPRDLRDDVEVTERGRIVLTDDLQERAVSSARCGSSSRSTPPGG